MELPKSLTAVIHMTFHYKEGEAKPVAEAEIVILNSVLARASELSPEQQETLLKFADYLNDLRNKQSPE